MPPPWCPPADDHRRQYRRHPTIAAITAVAASPPSRRHRTITAVAVTIIARSLNRLYWKEMGRLQNCPFGTRIIAISPKLLEV